ncbi:Aste57867_24440 [Aphanomyces stellatus]|uniref:Aste57867_24440 protein n=1 Tax=Aphanomyces stellatus TaxID=120398 RepID=A0A485LQN5_9STRA|nr:hypothetical protein As57867_024364 [Aphanomyces stellatus]VFU01080.1 Aste57867_24440 [Aphanomyces stellatus]
MNAWATPLVLNLTDSKAIHGLVLRNTGGHVHEDTVNTHPSVVFRASNNDIMAAINITIASTATMDVLNIEFDNIVPSRVTGSYLLDIYVPTQSLHYLEATQDRDVVVDPNALSMDAAQDVSIIASGGGNVYVQATNVAANHLLIAARSTGSIQLSIDDSIVASDIEVVATSSGSIWLLTSSTRSSLLTTYTLGSGNAIVAATNSLAVDTMLTHALGDGSIVFPNSGGACNASVVETMAGGSVYANLVDCFDSKVSLGGSGDVYLSSTVSLEVDDSGQGSVFAALAAATTTTGPFSPVPTNLVIPGYTILNVPDDFVHHIDLAGDSSDDDTTHAPSLRTHKSSDVGLLVFGIAMLVAAAATYALYRFKKARHAKRSMDNKLADSGFVHVSTPKETTTTLSL